MDTRPAPGTPAYPTAFTDRAEALALIRKLESADAYFGRIALGLALGPNENIEYFKYKEDLYHFANNDRVEALCLARSHPTVREILVAQGRVELIDGYDDPDDFDDGNEAFAIIRELESADAYYGPIALGLAFRDSDEISEYMENLYHAVNTVREEALCRARSHPAVREFLVAQGRVELIDGYDDPDDFDDDNEALAIIRELEEAADDVSRAFDVYQVAAWDTAYETFDGTFDQFVERRGAQLHAADARYEEVLSRARSHPTVREILVAQGNKGLLKDWLLAA